MKVNRNGFRMNFSSRAFLYSEARLLLVEVCQMSCSLVDVSFSSVAAACWLFFKALLPWVCRPNMKGSLTWQALPEDTPLWTMPGQTWHRAPGLRDGLGLNVCACL